MTKKGSKSTSIYKGLPLVDANEDLIIEIKKGDISTARAKDPANCAAANAAKRTLHTDVEVHISRIYVKDKNKKRWVRFFTPESISREITSFDRAHIFEPGVYSFKAPPKSGKLGEYHHGNKTKGNSSKKKPRSITMNIRESAKKAK